MHATDFNSLVSIFKTGLVPASLQHEKARHLADMIPAENSQGKRTTVQFTAIPNSKRQFMVREKKPLLLVLSASAIAANFEAWVFDDNPIVSTPQMIRPDLILAVLRSTISSTKTKPVHRLWSRTSHSGGMAISRKKIFVRMMMGKLPPRPLRPRAASRYADW